VGRAPCRLTRSAWPSQLSPKEGVSPDSKEVPGAPGAEAKGRCNAILKNVFPRLFGQFREGSFIRARFVVSAGPVYTRKTSVGTQDYSSLTMVDAGTGLVTLTLAGGARQAALVTAKHISQDATVTTARKVELYAYNEAAGTFSLKFINTAATEAVAAAANGDEIHVVLWVDK